MKVFGGLNKAQNTKEEVQGAVKERKAGKAAGCAVKCLKSGSISMIEWLVRLINVCSVISMVSLYYMSACVFPLYRSKGDKYECDRFRDGHESLIAALNLGKELTF